MVAITAMLKLTALYMIFVYSFYYYRQNPELRKNIFNKDRAA
jgi:hypothetical protein